MDSSALTSPETSHSQTDDERDSIAQLQDAVPQLESLFIISQCIGHGTFSSVYLARTKHTTTINGRRHFAVKHIIPTSHPSRVYMELKCLKLIGGADNVMGVTMCFREMNHIILIMPHFPHDSFADYVGCLSTHELQDYLMNLLIALKRVHSFKIIHRDVKPANFLYNRKQRRYSLIDFGLAQEAGQIRNPNSSDTGKLISSKELTSKSTSPPILDTPHMATSKTVKRKLGVCAGELLGSEKGKRPRHLSPPSAVVSGILSSTSNHVNTSLRRSPRKHCGIPVSPKKENCESHRKLELRKTPKKAYHNSLFHEDSPSKNTRSAEACRKTEVLGSNSGKDGVVGIQPGKHEIVRNLRRSPRKLTSISQSYMSLESLAKHLQDVTMVQVSTRSPVLKPGRNKADLDTSCDSLCASRSFSQRHRQSHGPVNCRSAVCGSPFTPNKNGVSSKPLKNGRVLQEVQTRSGSVLKPVSCHCYGSARLCGVCVGRNNQVAPRAGTPGFRAPEVLLRHPDQGTAVDMWSVGVILLCLLSGRYPFFRAVDDLSTLAEITTLLGTKTVRKAAAKLGKLLTCSEERNPLDLMKVCEILRNNSLKDSNTCSNVELCVGCRQQGICVCLSPPTRSFSPSRNMGYHNKRRTYVQEFHHQKKSVLPLANTCPSPTKKRNKSQISQKSPSKYFFVFSEEDLLSSLNKAKSLGTGSEKIYNKTDTQTCDRASPCSEKHCIGNSSCGLHQDTFSTNFIASPAEGVTSTSNAPSGYPLLVYHLLSRLLDPNPETRITAEEALAHPFLNC